MCPYKLKQTYVHKTCLPMSSDEPRIKLTRHSEHVIRDWWRDTTSTAITTLGLTTSPRRSLSSMKKKEEQSHCSPLYFAALDLDLTYVLPVCIKTNNNKAYIYESDSRDFRIFDVQPTQRKDKETVD